MKSIFLTIGIGLFTLVGHAQEAETRKLSSFSGIKVSEGIDAYLKKGSKEEVRVEASGTALSNVITEVSGDYLKIHMEEGVYRNRTVKVYVTYVSINSIGASSGANVFHEGLLKTDDLTLKASSAGTIELKTEAKTIEAGASSAGEIVVEGNAGSVELDASSAGEIDAYNLTCDKAEAYTSSGASVKVTVVKDLNARASSGGSIRYRGSPERSNTNSSSGGSVRKSN
jgi:Putative auto-transporter adhesin, head GIN domain